MVKLVYFYLLPLSWPLKKEPLMSKIVLLINGFDIVLEIWICFLPNSSNDISPELWCTQWLQNELFTSVLLFKVTNFKGSFILFPYFISFLVILFLFQHEFTNSSFNKEDMLGSFPSLKLTRRTTVLNLKRM